MKKIVMIVSALILAAFITAGKHYPSNMGTGLDMTLTPGGGGGSFGCSAGYSALTGADSSAVNDSTGAYICVPD